MSMEFKEAMRSIIHTRHSVRRFVKEHNVETHEIEELITLANRAPSAWNLQHWKYIVISDPEVKSKLHPIAYGQDQVIEASFTVVVLGDLEANRNAESVFQDDVIDGSMPEQMMQNLIGQIEHVYANYPSYSRDGAISNASLAAMQLMLTAKAAGLDSCPMGGFDAAKLIEAFHIPSRYIPVMLIAVGKMAEPARPSRRLATASTIVWNGF